MEPAYSIKDFRLVKQSFYIGKKSFGISLIFDLSKRRRYSGETQYFSPFRHMQSENLPKPLALGDILSKAWTIFSENFRLIALIILMVYVPLNGGMEYYLYTHASKESQNSL